MGEDIIAQPRLAKNELKQAWNEKLDQQDERERRREKKITKRERIRWEQMMPTEQEELHKLDIVIEQVKQRKLEEHLFGEFEGFED